MASTARLSVGPSIVIGKAGVGGYNGYTTIAGLVADTSIIFTLPNGASGLATDTTVGIKLAGRLGAGDQTYKAYLKAGGYVPADAIRIGCEISRRRRDRRRRLTIDTRIWSTRMRAPIRSAGTAMRPARQCRMRQPISRARPQHWRYKAQN